MNSTISCKKSKTQGQSLVEVALFLPLALMLIAGVVELGQWLVTQNRISAVARAGARFGSNGGEDIGMSVVALNTITQTLPVDSGRWDIFSIRGVFNDTGTALDEFSYTHIYGDGVTVRFSDFDEARARQEALQDFQQQLGGPDQTVAADTEFVGMLVIFDADSILNLEVFTSDIYSVWDLAVMRSYPSVPTTNGCNAFPMAIEEGIRSLGGENTLQFPNAGDFDFPTSDHPTLSDFPDHVSNVPLLNAEPGYMFYIENGVGQGNFSWLVWNEYATSTAGTLGSNLQWPGRSQNYHTTTSGTPLPDAVVSALGLGGNTPIYGFVENSQGGAGDITDVSMHVDDFVTVYEGSADITSVNDHLSEHIDRDRTLRIIVWRNGESYAAGGDRAHKIVGFAVVRIHGYRVSSGTTWLLAEFVSWDTSCGQVNPEIG